jgi:hypothetical protein
MRPAFGTDVAQPCGVGPEMKKALAAPRFRPGLKSPWCASAIPQTLIPDIAYFYRLPAILTEFSVREQRGRQTR